MTPWEWLTILLACAADEIDEQTVEGFDPAPSRRYVSAEGGVVFDDCCEDGGQLWTRTIEAMPVDPLPAKDDSFTKCQGTTGLHVGVGIVRCGHTLDSNRRAPSAENLTADARQINEDMISIRRAIVCCAGGSRLVLGAWTPAPGSESVGGGCIGGEWDVWVPSRFDATVSGSP